MTDVPVEQTALLLLLNVAKSLADVDPSRDTHIGSAGETLARRIILSKTPESCIYFHEWMRSDPDDLHDHPWNSVSLVLSVGYFEVCREEQFLPMGASCGFKEVRHWRPPGSVVFRTAEDRHRIEILPGTHPTSMFITSVNRREWGFHTKTGFIVGREYRALPPTVKAEISTTALLDQRKHHGDGENDTRAVSVER